MLSASYEPCCSPLLRCRDVVGAMQSFVFTFGPMGGKGGVAMWETALRASQDSACGIGLSEPANSI